MTLVTVVYYNYYYIIIYIILLFIIFPACARTGIIENKCHMCHLSQKELTDTGIFIVINHAILQPYHLS